jgi:hypothetical protein
VTEVSRKALKATVVLKAIAVSRKIKAVINISRYLYVRKNVIFVTSQVINQ